ncbi:MAG: hypothetical protein ABI317_15650 [Gaiellales bacterium]
MTDERTPPREHDEERLDEELAESFPASDPPSTWAGRDDEDEGDGESSAGPPG